MLTLGSGSACDICLEPFSTGIKAASAIVCGHAFCSECINNLRAAPPTTNHPDTNFKPCPLCRHTFDTRQYIRLHVDHDTHATARAASAPSPSETEAKSLLEKIIGIANKGSTQEESRLVIADTRQFLHLQRDTTKFIELRTCYRMLHYTTNTRAIQIELEAQLSELKAKEADIRSQLTRTIEEKTEVERRAKEDKEISLSIEKSLHEHARVAREGYEAMIYNRVASELSAICEHLRHQRDDSGHNPTRALSQPSTRELASSITQRLESYHEEHVRRDGHVIADPQNFMVSPLAMFSALPTQSFSLPDETEVEPPPPEPKRRSQSATCRDGEHLAGCSCIISYPESSQSIQQSSAFRSRVATVQDRPAPAISNGLSPVPIAQHDRIADQYTTNDYDRVPKNHRTSPRAGRAHHAPRDLSPYNRDHPSNRAEGLAQPSPSSHTPAPTGRSHGRRSSIPLEERAPPVATTSTHTPSQSESPRTRSIRNHMLQGLLQDTLSEEPQTFLPNADAPPPAAPSPSAYRRDSDRQDERGSVGQYTLPQPSPELVTAVKARRMADPSEDMDELPFIPPLEQAPTRPPPLSYNPAHAPVPASTYEPIHMSSASSAAKAKERERAERAEREKWEEAEMARKQAEREERHRAKRAEMSSIHTHGSSSSSKNRRPSTDHTQQAPSSSRHSSSASRDPPPPYTSASQRASGPRSNRYAEKYATDSHGHQYIPTHYLSATPA
ncbi:hypothetical protein DXG01_009074 [Tephrocybe rancida]|nr:hypothetical protein DXG01_009074 [Tephrocybe rancida]